MTTITNPSPQLPSLIDPYGGPLVDLMIPEEEREAMTAHAMNLPSIRLTERAACDLELLSIGAFSPLDRFMSQADYQRVVAEMRLDSSHLSPIPITLQIEPGRHVQLDAEVALRDARNNLLAVMTVEEIYGWSVAEEAQQIYGSQDLRHPMVAEMHRLGKIDFDSFRGEKGYNPLRAYGQSKLANVLFTRELAKRFEDTNISAFCLHPGAVGTNIAGRSLWRRSLYKLVGGVLTPARGARTSVYLAHTPDIERYSGSYFDEFCRVKPGSKRSRDGQVAAKLWQVSEQLIAQ